MSRELSRGVHKVLKSTGRQVDDGQHFVTFGQQAIDEMAADKSGPAGDETTPLSHAGPSLANELKSKSMNAALAVPLRADAPAAKGEANRDYLYFIVSTPAI